MGHWAKTQKFCLKNAGWFICCLFFLVVNLLVFFRYLFYKCSEFFEKVLVQGESKKPGRRLGMESNTSGAHHWYVKPAV